MIKNQVEPMSAISGQVHTTNDYFLFKSIDGNRNKSLPHINRLKKSMGSSYLFTVIIVNEKHEIIDGQHRFDVIQDLKLPLHYIICKGYGLNEVHILNQNSKTWNADDYLTGYCQLGYEHYIEYAKFKSKFGFGHNECMAMLSDRNASGGDNCLSFKDGGFIVKNLKGAQQTAEKIWMFNGVYAGFRRRSFVYAMLYLLDKPQFDFKEFLEANKPKIAECFKSFSYGSASDRQTFDDACDAITDPEKLKEFKAKHEDKNRSSMSQWVKGAWQYGERMS